MSRILSRRLVVAWAATLAVAGGASYGLVDALASAGQPGAVWRGGRLVDPRFGWTIWVPKGMWVGHFQTNEFYTDEGVRISNFAPDLEASGGISPPVAWTQSMPADGVALQIWFGERLPERRPLQDTKLPLAPGTFHRVDGWPYVGGLPAPLYRRFSGDGHPFFADVWLGVRASRANHHRIWRMVKSLRFASDSTRR
jgi:hypothetical protein